MTEWEAVEKRISCRAYRDEPLPEEILRQLEEKAAALREASGLRFVPVRGKPAVKLAAAMFSGRVDFCAALIGPDDALSAEKLGYYGQELVLYATQLGLGTCWVAGTYKRGKCKAVLEDGEKIVCVIAIGYGESEGTRHKSKPLSKICDIPEADMPVWFKNGVKAAMMAPTAMNQQKFKITLEGGRPVITAGAGPMTRIDLGIVKYNFEAVSGHKV